MDDIRLKNAIDFMMFSYFGLTLEEGGKEELLNASIKKAYSDATQQGAYNTLVKKGEMKKKSKKAKDDGTEEIKEAIRELMENGVDDFQKWHKKICTDLCEVYKKVRDDQDKKIFTYGNAQKWVNMSLKYLYILNGIYNTFLPECEFCKNYGANIKKYEKVFHIPVDSYIIEAVWDREDVKLPLKNEGMKKRGTYNSEKVLPWSKWEEEQYLNFQESLCKPSLLKDLPLIWENQEWIKVARERKKKK